MPLGTEIGLYRPTGHCVDGDPAPSPKKGTTVPHFLADFYCGQTAGWIKMPLGMEVGPGPGDIVLHGDPAPPRKGAQQVPHFSAHVYCGWVPGDLTQCRLGRVLAP